MADVPMLYLSQGDYMGALGWIMNNYLPFGIMWILIAIAIYGVTYEKSRSAAIAGFIFSMFIGMVITFAPISFEIKSMLTALIALMFFVSFYKLVR